LQGQLGTHSGNDMMASTGCPLLQQKTADSSWCAWLLEHPLNLSSWTTALLAPIVVLLFCFREYRRLALAIYCLT
jgi:hypothetical protein